MRQISACMINMSVTKIRLFKYIENFATKNWKFSDNYSDIFHICAQNIDCGYSLEPPRQGGSNEYPQSMFLDRNLKNNIYPCIPQFYPRPRVKLTSCKSALNPPVVYSTDRSKAVVPVLVLFFVSLWFILRGDLLYVFPCVILFLCLCFLVLLVLRLPRLGKRELILVLFVRLFDLCLFRFVGFLFLLGSGKGCGLWLWHSLVFPLTFFLLYKSGV